MSLDFSWNKYTYKAWRPTWTIHHLTTFNVLSSYANYYYQPTNKVLGSKQFSSHEFSINFLSFRVQKSLSLLIDPFRRPNCHSSHDKLSSIIDKCGSIKDSNRSPVALSSLFSSLVLLMAKPNHVTSISSRKTAIPLSSIICRRPSNVKFNKHQSREVNSAVKWIWVDKEREKHISEVLQASKYWKKWNIAITNARYFKWRVAFELEHASDVYN